MIVDWKVMSARNATSYCYKPAKMPSIIISINNSFEMGAKLFCDSKNKVTEILKLYFDDVRKQELYLSKEGAFSVPLWLDRYGRCYSPIEEADCKKIHDFVMKYHKMNKEFLLIVHCSAGISRSSGAMAAIWKYLFKDDSIIFDNPYYKPNKDVYNSLLNYFYKQEGIDNMDIAVENLRFGVEKSPWGYSPNASLKDNNEKDLIFVPSVEMVNLVPELASAFIEVKNDSNKIRKSLPFFKFTIATTITNKTSKKVEFSSMLSSDNQCQKREDTAAYKIIDFYERTNYFPSLEVRTENYNTLKGNFTRKEYIITFLNKESNYFSSLTLDGIFKEKYERNKTDPKDIVVEYEYTFGEYKTWVYELFSSRNYSPEAFSGIIFLMGVTNHKPLLALESTRKVKDDVLGNYEIFMLNSNNHMPAILTYTEEEWNNEQEFFKHLTGIRLANWSYD